VTTVTDDFTRANETPLAGNWSTITGESAFNLASNVATPSAPANDNGARYSGATWGNDQQITANLTVPGASGGGAGIGLNVRIAAAARTYYRFTLDHSSGVTWELSRFIAGAITLLDSGSAFSWTDGDSFTLSAVGPAAATVLTLKRNGVQFDTFTDNSSLASGSPGIAWSSGTGNTPAPTVDNVSITDEFPVAAFEADWTSHPKYKLRRAPSWGA
jgi:hypothetical protein